MGRGVQPRSPARFPPVRGQRLRWLVWRSRRLRWRVLRGVSRSVSPTYCGARFAGIPAASALWRRSAPGRAFRPSVSGANAPYGCRFSPEVAGSMRTLARVPIIEPPVAGALIFDSQNTTGPHCIQGWMYSRRRRKTEAVINKLPDALFYRIETSRNSCSAQTPGNTVKMSDTTLSGSSAIVLV